MTPIITKFIIKNRLLASMAVFTVLFLLLVAVKPNFVFDHDGAFRHFGVGNTSKTVIPMWLCVIMLSLMSYYLITYLIAYPNLSF